MGEQGHHSVWLQRGQGGHEAELQVVIHAMFALRPTPVHVTHHKTHPNPSYPPYLHALMHSSKLFSPLQYWKTCSKGSPTHPPACLPACPDASLPTPSPGSSGRCVQTRGSPRPG
jgi:hypothetical protein